MFHNEYTADEGMVCPYLRGRMIQDQRERESTRTEEEEQEEEVSTMLPPETPLCRFFVLGKCRYGSRCTYSHQLPAATFDLTENADADTNATEQLGSMVDCPFFLRGNCKYGDFCKLRHSDRSKSNSSSSSSNHQTTAATREPDSTISTNTSTSDYTCGICFDDIVASGKRFGLMNCDHCYCVDCLREWRQSKALERDVTRTCPSCRLSSNYIVPSIKFCTGEEKKQVIEAYKQHLSRRECKYFNGHFGSCPFGRNCFYAHFNAQGKNVKDMDVSKKLEQNRIPKSMFAQLLAAYDEEDLVDLLRNSIWPLQIDMYQNGLEDLEYEEEDYDYYFPYYYDEEEEEEEEQYEYDYDEEDDDEEEEEDTVYY